MYEINSKVAGNSVYIKDPKLKLDEDPLQRHIYSLTFVESLEMIFSQYKETCEVLLYYTNIVGEDMKYYVRKEIGNILHANIAVYSRIFIDEFPLDGVKCISKIQSDFANMTFSDKSTYVRIFHKITHKVGSRSELHQYIPECTGFNVSC